jgi:sugar phosphate permease
LLQEHRGSAMGFFNWGIYLGYSLSFVLIAAERALGWRVVYYIAGTPGLVVAVLLLVTVIDPPRGAKSDTQVGL